MVEEFLQQHQFWSYLASRRKYPSFWILSRLSPWIYPYYQMELFGCWFYLRAIWSISGILKPTDPLEADKHLLVFSTQSLQTLDCHRILADHYSTIWILQTILEHGNVYMGEEKQRQCLVFPCWIYSISVELHSMEWGNRDDGHS